MKQSESLKIKTWIYLIAFSIAILLFLWLFQIIFLDAYYETSKTNDLNIAIREIKNNYKSDEFIYKIDTISRDNGICVQLVINNNLEYNSISFNKGCIPDTTFDVYKKDFINNSLDTGTVKLVNNKYGNEVLIKAIKLSDNTYAFASVSLVPLDSTISILKNQLLIVSCVVLILAFVIGFFISKRISVPIERINNGVKEFSKGNYKVKFKTHENIKEIDELVGNLNDAAEKLDKTETLRNELLANVSHDLKTPLTMIKAYAEMVRDINYKDKKKMNDNLNVIIDETDRMSTLVSDIIELSKWSSGAVELTYESFDLIEVIKNIINKFDILDYNFTFTHDKNEFIVNADKKRIEQVMYNLISNAIKFTGKDKKVNINIKENKVSVSDTGKGIDPKDIELIWDRYYKADKKYKRSDTGSGIGLSIVKSIFIKHGYTYGVDSSKNKGTTFWFIIN